MCSNRLRELDFRFVYATNTNVVNKRPNTSACEEKRNWRNRVRDSRRVTCGVRQRDLIFNRKKWRNIMVRYRLLVLV